MTARASARAKLVALARWAVFALAALILNFPVIATFVTSLKGDAEIATNPSLWIVAPTLGNYAAIFAMADRFDILHFLSNSLIESLLGTIMAVVLAFPAAYAICATTSVAAGCCPSWSTCAPCHSSFSRSRSI